MAIRSRKVLLENARIVTNNAQRDFFYGDIVLADNRIASVVEKKPGDPHPPRVDGSSPYADYAEVFDLAGKIVIPGFVQGHVHLCQALFRNLADDLELLDWLKKKIWPMEARHSPESLYASARVGIAELLASGTTTVLDMGTVRHTDVVFAAAQELGIRATIGKCMMDLAETSLELGESHAESFAESVRLSGKWHGKENGRLRYAFAPRFVLSCSSELLQETAQYARTHGMLVRTHASENQAEVALVREKFGLENVEFLHKLGLTGPNLVLAHCIWLSEAEVRILADTGTKVVHCPSANLKLASGIARIPELRAAGITVGLGADGAPCNNNLSIFQEMRLASLIQKPRLGPQALGAAEAFEMATWGGAKVLGLEKEIGSLEAGKKADLVVLDLDLPHSCLVRAAPSLNEILSAIVYSANQQNVVQTWVDGTLRYQEGVVGDFDLADFAREARAEAARFADL